MLVKYNILKHKLEKQKVEVSLHQKFSNDWFTAYHKAFDLLNQMEEVRNENKEKERN